MAINDLPKLDHDGHLCHLEDWTPEVGQRLASMDDLELTKEHWKYIGFLRTFHQEYQHIPKMRILIKALLEEFPSEFANSQNLYELFPLGPIKQGCKIAGLPKPPHCI